MAQAEVEAGLEPSSPHYQFKPSALLHLASLLKCTPSDWDQEPFSESRVTQLCCLMKVWETSHAMPPRLRFLPLGWFPNRQSSSQGQFRWKSKMPNPSNLYVLGFYLGKFILVPAGRGQEVETPEMISGFVCVCVCVRMHTHLRVHERLEVHSMGDILPDSPGCPHFDLEGSSEPKYFFLFLSPCPSPTAEPLG